MAVIFGGLYICKFCEYGKLAKIKSRDFLAPLPSYKEREHTREHVGNVPNQGCIFVPSTANRSSLWFPVAGKHLAAAASPNTLINVVSANATLKPEPWRHCWLPFPTNNKELNLNTWCAKPSIVLSVYLSIISYHYFDLLIKGLVGVRFTNDV